MALPEAFLRRMGDLLGPELDDYLACMDMPPRRGVRWNPLKCGFETLAAHVPFPLSPTPFSPLCWEAAGMERPGGLPAHHAGMFYAQEPSASSAVTALDPQPGDRVLDLCAAPGGKSTQIAALLAGRGLLWSNEVVRGRAQALLSNCERMGVGGAVISRCPTQRLCQRLRGFFDRVLVDAPCSGEGLFRRDPAAAAAWTPETPAACAQRQRAILEDAALAVREGGVLVYSTCTFSWEENEGVAAAFLAARPDFQAEAIPAAFGRPALDGSPARRVFPMDGGEGHFVARFRRVGAAPRPVGTVSPPALPKAEAALAARLWEDLFRSPCPEGLALSGDRLLLPPEGMPDLRGLGVLRAGVEAGVFLGRRLEPSHGLFMSREKSDCRRALDFSQEDPALAAFLRGEELDCPEPGYTAVCVGGVVTGFGKASGGRLKNRYPKGLRNLR